MQHTHTYTQHISGPRLLQLDETALVAIGIKDEYRRRTILYGIKELKDGEFNSPRNFQEFKVYPTHSLWDTV